jgi:hypothetical protein
MEREKFPEATQVYFSDKNTVLVCRKIARHFNFLLKNVYFKGNRRSVAYYNRNIRFSHNPTLLTIAHETAHLWQLSKGILRGSRHHTKSMLRLVERILNFCCNNESIIKMAIEKPEPEIHYYVYQYKCSCGEIYSLTTTRKIKNAEKTQNGKLWLMTCYTCEKSTEHILESVTKITKEDYDKINNINFEKLENAQFLRST